MQVDELRLLRDVSIAPGTRVLLRLDLNVPCRGAWLVDDYRIRRTFPTLKFLAEHECRTVIMSHLDPDAGDTLKLLCQYLARTVPVTFAQSLAQAQEKAKEIASGGFLLVENIRREAGEAENSKALAELLAGLGDIFVNDAFAVLHRAHASVVGVAKLLPSCAGFLVADEVKHLSRATDPAHPSLFILG